MLIIRRVVGDSMQPTLKDGQIVIAITTRNFRRGQVVCAFQNGREVVKRIVDMRDGLVMLEGDNKKSSTDSRTLGPLMDDKVEGIVWWPFGIHRT